MRRVRNSLHKREPDSHNVEIRGHSSCLLLPRKGGLVADSWRKKLCQEPLGGTAFWAFDFGMAISDWFSTAMT